jgi:hypothetical protein
MPDSTKLKQFLAAGQVPEGDFSFPSLGTLQRNTGTVEEAASKLNLEKDK